MGIGALVATRAVQMTPSYTEAARNAPCARHHRRTRDSRFAEAAVHSVQYLDKESARIAALLNELIAAISALIRRRT